MQTIKTLQPPLTVHNIHASSRVKQPKEMLPCLVSGNKQNLITPKLSGCHIQNGIRICICITIHIICSASCIFTQAPLFHRGCYVHLSPTSSQDHNQRATTMAEGGGHSFQSFTQNKKVRNILG